MKTIAVLTMCFLPGTFVAVSSLARLKTPTFQLPTVTYLLCNAPFRLGSLKLSCSRELEDLDLLGCHNTTIFVLVVWRAWYVFQKWRNSIKADTANFVVWLRSGSFKVDEEVAGSGRTKSFSV